MSCVQMNQKHVDSIFLEVYVGLKIKGDQCAMLEYVSKAKRLKNNARHCAEQKTHLPSCSRNHCSRPRGQSWDSDVEKHM